MNLPKTSYIDLNSLNYTTQNTSCTQRSLTLAILQIQFFFLKRLIFLIRDWGFPHDFKFGEYGGERYVEKQLQVSKELIDEYHK